MNGANVFDWIEHMDDVNVWDWIEYGFKLIRSDKESWPWELVAIRGLRGLDAPNKIEFETGLNHPMKDLLDTYPVVSLTWIRASSGMIVVNFYTDTVGCSVIHWDGVSVFEGQDSIKQFVEFMESKLI